jgi:hypothetical protein
MPKTSLFEVELHIAKEYMKKTYGINYDENDEDDEEEDDIYYDEKEIIKPGMTFMMNYTQTKLYYMNKNDNLYNYVLEDASIKVTVVSVRTVIDDGPYYGIYVLGCVLKTDTPIYISIRSAYYGRKLTLHTETTTVATGNVKEVLDF